MRKRQIPAVPRSASEQGRVEFDSSIKENMEVITGRRGTPLTTLADDATLADVIVKINELINRLQ